MQDLDDLLDRTVAALSRKVEVDGVLERTIARKHRRKARQRAGVVLIIAVFLSVTVTGALILTRSFRVGRSPRPVATRPIHLPLTGNGKIAFASDADGGTGNWDIYVMNQDGTGLVRLTSDPEVESRPVWSPYGTKILFTRANADGSAPEIYTMNADGSGLTDLTGGAGGSKPAWSPDGRTIAFARGSEIFLMNSDGSDVRQLTHSGEGVADYPAWSPDGKTIAFTSGIANPGEVTLIGADGSGRRTIFSEADPGVSDLIRPGSWSPDGTTILFERAPTSGAKDQSVAGIWSIKPDGTGLTKLSSDETDGFACWSPDGTRILFIRKDQDVYVMNADGSGLTKRTTDTTTKYFTSWQPIMATF